MAMEDATQIQNHVLQLALLEEIYDQLAQFPIPAPVELSALPDDVFSTPEVGMYDPAPLLPLFTGVHPDKWLAYAERYFTYYRIHNTERFPYVQNYFHDEAAIWFSFSHLTEWSDFRESLVHRFGYSQNAFQVFDEMPDHIETEIVGAIHSTIDNTVLEIQSDSVVVVNETLGVKDAQLPFLDYIFMLKSAKLNIRVVLANGLNAYDTVDIKHWVVIASSVFQHKKLRWLGCGSLVSHSFAWKPGIINQIARELTFKLTDAYFVPTFGEPALWSHPSVLDLVPVVPDLVLQLPVPISMGNSNTLLHSSCLITLALLGTPRFLVPDPEPPDLGGIQCLLMALQRSMEPCLNMEGDKQFEAANIVSVTQFKKDLNPTRNVSRGTNFRPDYMVPKFLVGDKCLCWRGSTTCLLYYHNLTVHKQPFHSIYLINPSSNEITTLALLPGFVLITCSPRCYMSGSTSLFMSSHSASLLNFQVLVSDSDYTLLATSLLLQLAVMDDSLNKILNKEVTIQTLTESMAREDKPEVYEVVAVILSIFVGTYTWTGESYTIYWFYFPDEEMAKESQLAFYVRHTNSLGNLVFYAFKMGFKSNHKRISACNLEEVIHSLNVAMTLRKPNVTLRDVEPKQKHCAYILSRGQLVLEVTQSIYKIPRNGALTILGALLTVCGSLVSLLVQERLVTVMLRGTAHIHPVFVIVLLHMHIKSGAIGDAFIIFNLLQPNDILAWNNMLIGMGMHVNDSEVPLKAYGVFQWSLLKDIHQAFEIFAVALMAANPSTTSLGQTLEARFYKPSMTCASYLDPDIILFSALYGHKPPNKAHCTTLQSHRQAPVRQHCLHKPGTEALIRSPLISMISAVTFATGLSTSFYDLAP